MIDWIMDLLGYFRCLDCNKWTKNILWCDFCMKLDEAKELKT